MLEESADQTWTGSTGPDPEPSTTGGRCSPYKH